MAGTRHHGVLHRRGCACPLCDPDGKLLAAARERARAARAAGVRVVDAPPRPLVLPRPVRWRLSESARDRRFRELLSSGLTAARAMAVVEAEFQGGNPDGQHD